LDSGLIDQRCIDAFDDSPETLTDNLAFQEFDFPALRTDCLVLCETDEFLLLLLLTEMHHRLANTLTIVTSVLRRERRPNG
jgi:hypothetical protein